ncbi:MAG: nitrile hydratase subunit alpha [Pseudomonadota bacterium]
MSVHDHDHPHDHDHDHAPISDGDGPISRFELLETAIRELLIEKGLFSGADVQAQIDATESRNTAFGADLIAKAWTDPDFKDNLIANPRATLGEMGIDVGPIAELQVVENTSDLHHVVVCTLCSCYPRMLLGVPPAWYKSTAYRSRVVKDPRGVLREFGMDLPDTTKVRVLDSTADLRFLVIPRRPQDTETFDTAALAGLVTRDSMIGTGQALPAKERQ